MLVQAELQMAPQPPDLPGPRTQEEPPETRRRRKEERVVVRVRAGGKESKASGGSPADSWSWRKYGQKPIKGSPYPRSYYRCSASKGCPAKKQVERCSTDASVVVVTYTADHDHPGPRLLHIGSMHGAQELDAVGEDHEAPRPPSPVVVLQHSGDQMEGQEGMDSGDQQPSDVSDTKQGDALEAARMPREEDRFFDELEELPLSLLCSSVMRSNFFDERKLLLPF